MTVRELTIVEGMRDIKRLMEKCGNLEEKISKHSADYDIEKPVYGTPDEQTAQVQEWVQSHTDSVHEICDLKRRLTKTNVETKVTITIGDNAIERTITEWIARRTQLSSLHARAFACLNDRRLDKNLHLGASTPGAEDKVINIRRYYDPKARDKQLDALRDEPHLINQTLEVINATTQLVD